MNNLILGSDGFLGKNLCQYLEHKGENVTKFDIKTNKNQDLRYCNLPLKNIDRVYFLAWDVGGSKYLYNNSTQDHQLIHNTELMVNVFNQIENIPFVFTSSQLANDMNSVYGIQKRMGEVWTKNTKNGVSVRLWNLYGYIEEYNERSHVVSDIVHQARTNNKIILNTTGEELRQFVHIDDICEGLYKSFDVTKRDKSYDLTTKKWTKIYDVAKIVSNLTGSQLIVSENLGKTFLIEDYNILPGWIPKISLLDGLTKMIKK